MFRVTLLLSLLSPGLAAAQDALSAESFDALTRGKTYYYSSGGRPYGAEEYLEGRRVRWSFLDGQCLEGRWWAENDNICFVYDDAPDDPHCWVFRQGSGGLTATLADEPSGRELYEVEKSDKPLHCLGPKVGV